MIKKFIAEKDHLIEENRLLEENLEIQKQIRIEKIEQKKQDKEKATDKLKKEMLEKIQITKTGTISTIQSFSLWKKNSSNPRLD